MKSVKKNIKLIISLVLIFSILTLSILIGVEIYKTNLRNRIQITDKGIIIVNSIISDLYNLRNENENIELNLDLINEIRHKYNDLMEIVSDNIIFKENEEIEKLLNESMSNNVPLIIDLMGNIARQIREKRISFQNRLEFYYSIITYLVILSILGLLILLLFVKKVFNRSNLLLKNITEHLNSIINFEDHKLDFRTLWKEENIVLNNINIIDDEMKLTRKLLDLGLNKNISYLMEYVYKLLPENFPNDRFSLAFIDERLNVIAESAVCDYSQIELNEGFSEHINKTSLVKVIKNKEYRIINDLENHYNETHKSKSTELILKEGMKSSLTIPFYFDNKCYGFVFFSSKSKNAYNNKNAKFAEKIVSLIKNSIFSHYVIQEIISISTEGFVNLVEGKDNETGDHISRVSLYSRIIAKTLSKKRQDISPRVIREIYWFAPLHDIGKVGINDNILLKPGKLDKEEFEEMKKHVVIGENIIKGVNEKIEKIFGYKIMNIALDIISGHHEKYDGSGYPKGLKGEDIPIAGRIVALADVFDALTTERPYKKAFTLDDSLKIINDSIGTHFDPEVIEAFYESFDKIKLIHDGYKD